MQQIKRQVQLGNLELARLDSQNKPVPIQYSDLQSTQKTQNNYARLVEKVKELSPEEQEEWVNIKRLRGSQLCRKKKWEQAMDVYIESMLGINIKEEDEQKLKEINLEQKYPIMLNIAVCSYQLKNYKAALQLCDKVLSEKHGQYNLKALFRKANCLIAMGDINAAYQVAQKMSLLKKEDKQPEKRGDITSQDISKLIQQINSKNNNQKVVYKRMFDIKDPEEDPLLPKKDKQVKEETINYEYGIKQQCIDWCKQTWDSVWSCLSRKRTGQKTD